MNEHALANRKARGSFILDPAGKRFDFATPEAADFDIALIAVALAREGRFSNFTIQPVSVASHSINVATLAGDAATDAGEKPEYEEAAYLAGLLHDIEEAYLRDLSTPLKTLLPDYCALSDRVKKAMIAKLWPPAAPVSFWDPRVQRYVHWADSLMCDLERKERVVESAVWPTKTDEELHETHGVWVSEQKDSFGEPFYSVSFPRGVQRDIQIDVDTEPSLIAARMSAEYWESYRFASMWHLGGIEP